MAPIQAHRRFQHDNALRAARRAWLAKAHLLASAALVLLLPAIAHAAPWVNGTQATYFYRTGLQLDAGAGGANRTYRFETANLTGGADPIMHVVRNTGFVEVGQNDDYPGLGLNARVDVTVNGSTAGIYTIIVRNGKGSESGKGDVKKDGVTIGFATQRQFGGRVINIVPTGTLTYETALTPNGCDDTYIIGLNASGQVVAKDDQSGVGNASRFTSSTTRKVVVGAHSELKNGPTTLYVNKPTPDADGDGLCDELETELGTCKTTTCVINGQNTFGKDTDRDGLTDKMEVFGVEDPTDMWPQMLPAWGARPLHKDLFVELDYTNDFSTNPFTAADGRAAARFLAEGSAADVLNPDGQPGIRLHTDIGILDGSGGTDFGSWWGTNQSVHRDDWNGAASFNDPNDFVVMRRGIFHHGLMGRGAGGKGGIYGQYFVWWASESNRQIQGGYVHELGHNIGLDHFGVSAWGGYQCKPTYRSLMNYAYEFDGVTSFSHGLLSSYILNPSGTLETGLFGPVDVSFLGGAPFYYTTFPNGSNRSVDWNRDGRAEPATNSVKVRAALTFGQGPFCDGFSNGSQSVDSGTHPIFAPDAPKFAKVFNHLYLFYVDPTGVIQYRHGTVPGVGSSGSCNSLTNCVTWSAAVSVPANGTVTGLSVATWGTNLFFVYRNSAGNIYTKSASGIQSNGDVLGWSGDTSAGTSSVTPELTIMYVNPALYNGHSEVAAIFAVSSGGYKMITGTSTAGAWSTNFVYGPTGSPLSGIVTPTVISWPNRGGVNHAAYGTSCGTFVDAFTKIGFYCYDKATNRWQDLSAQMFAATGSVYSNVKTGLAYHVPRINTGAPLVNTVYGQFLMAAVPSDNSPRMYVSNASQTSPVSSGVSFTAGGYFGTGWDIVLPGSGFTLYEDETISATKGTAIYFHDHADPDQRWAQLTVHGFADGTFNANLKDGNDWQVIEHGMCISLGQDINCGKNKFGY
jgi:hypothetical protein